MFAMTKAIRGQTLAGLVLSLLAGALLAGCGGSAGSAGATGPAGGAGSTGPGGSPLAHSISLAKTITAQITGVTGGDSPTIYFNLVDQNGQPLYGLQASQVRFAIAKLVPGSNGSSSTWQSYINTVAQPVAGGWGTVPTRQPTAEVASTSGGAFTDNGDGTYTYKLSKSLDAYTPADAQGPAVAFEPTLTHRVGLELRGTGVSGANNGINNGVFNYVPATGATTNYMTRDIVGNKECDACHAQFGMHGGARIDVAYCTICHNPGNTDPTSGNTLDFKVLAHKIHSGSILPTVVAAGSTAPAPGVGYTIWGYGGSISNFNTVVWPQDTRNCTTCHNSADPLTPDADNYKNAPNSAACGACHDNVNFTTGANHGPTQQPATDADCVTCHGPAATVNQGGWQVVPEHVNTLLQAEAQFQFTVTRVEAVQPDKVTVEPACVAKVAAAAAGTTVACTVPPGDYPRVTIMVTNPQTGSVYSLTDAPFANQFFATGASSATTARVRARVAYSTLNYTNPGQNTGGSATQAGLVDFMPSTKQADGTYTFALPPANADGSYTALAANPVPATLTVYGGSGGVSMEGRAVANLAKAGDPTSLGMVPIKAADPLFFPITDAKAVARREVVDTANCLRCHKSLEVHGGSRSNNVRLCIMCHNPAQAPRMGTNGSQGTEPVDFKFFIHSLHSANYKFGQVDFSGIGFPGVLNNCLGCHKTDTYYPVDPSKVAATSIDAGASSNTMLAGYDNPLQHIAITANAAACGACHVDGTAQTHMKQNGAVIITDQFPAGLQFGAPNVLSASPLYIKGANGMTLPQYQTETCLVCHGPGATADVKVVHQATSFKYN